MRVVGKTMQERAGAGGNGVDDFLAGNYGSERGVSAGEPFRGDQNIWLDIPMLRGKIAPGASHAGHYFVGNDEHAVPTADLRERWQISRGWDDRTKCCSADRLKDKSGGLAVRQCDGLLDFGRVLQAAVAAAIRAIEGAAIAVGHADMRK